jgi:hypothetical protein
MLEGTLGHGFEHSECSSSLVYADKGGDHRVFCNNSVFDPEGRPDQWIEAPIPRDE